MIERIKNSDLADLREIAHEVRKIIIESVSVNGGHLASSLGTVELTIALLKVFDLSQDKIIWDVGHQAYPYKVLTDRKDSFNTLRTLSGISGFPKISESKYDFFGTGHGGTSISAVLGYSASAKLRKETSTTVSVIGDGAMTSGLALEAMNNVAEYGSNTITILNDNDMFISTSVGSLSKWFSRKLSGHGYSAARKEIKQMLSRLPAFFQGEKIVNLIKKAINSSKSLLTPGILFEGFGYQYVGPIDGYNFEELIETLNDVKLNQEPVLLHVQTVKGKGFEYSESNPKKFHGVGPFNIKTGKIEPSGPSFTGYLSDYLPELFKRNQSLVAITAAMPDGTGLCKLQSLYPDRTFDVGMSEGHAVTFAAGLAAGGMRPVVTIYSTFLQRALDSIIHDVALQKLPVIFLVDRAGIVGEDGATHHGLFDISYFRMIPGMVLMAPKDEHEMVRMIETAVKYQKGPTAIRYPRGSARGRRFYSRMKPVKLGSGEVLSHGKETLMVISVGFMTIVASEAVKQLEKQGISVWHYDLKFIKPLPEDLFDTVKKMEVTKIITIEEGIVAGGAGSAILEELSHRDMHVKCRIIGITDTFSTHGSQQELRNKEGLTLTNIVSTVKSMLK